MKIFVMVSLLALEVTAADKPNVLELLDKYAQTQDKIYSSFVMKFEASIDGYRSHTYALERGKRKGGVDSEIRFDGKRFYCRTALWANCFPDVKTYTPRNDPKVKWELWDGSFHYIHGQKMPDWFIKKTAERLCKTARQREEHFKKCGCVVDVRNKFERYSHFYPRKVIHPDKKGKIELDRSDFYFTDMCGGGGYYYDPHLAVELRNVDKLVLRDKTEKINGCDCYVIEAADKDSKYKLSIDPSHGYNIAKFHQVQKHLNPNNSTSTIRTKIENVRFQRIDDVWVPMEWDFTFHRNSGKTKFIKSTTHIKRTQVLLNPDHDALGSLVPDIPNGWSVRFKDFKGINEQGEYIWRNGKVVDKNGRTVMDCLKKPKGNTK